MSAFGAPYRRRPLCVGEGHPGCRLRSVTPYHSLDGALIVPSGIAISPWSSTVQHGATLAGLVARAVETMPSVAPMHLARLTVDLTRATPLGPTRVETEVVRNGKRIQVVDVTVLVDDHPYCRGQGLRIRTDAVIPPADLPPLWDTDGAPTEPPLVPVVSPLGTSPFLQSLDMKWESWDPGCGVLWIHLGDWFVDGETTTPATRAAVAAELVMTGGGLLSTDHYRVVNADLGINLTRAPVGEDIRVSSVVRVNAGGHGISEGVMHDRLGRFGSVTKALLIDRRM
jgi:hypothetical protein